MHFKLVVLLIAREHRGCPVRC